jgi:hypothetical protein
MSSLDVRRKKLCEFSDTCSMRSVERSSANRTPWGWMKPGVLMGSSPQDTKSTKGIHPILRQRLSFGVIRRSLLQRAFDRGAPANFRWRLPFRATGPRSTRSFAVRPSPVQGNGPRVPSRTRVQAHRSGASACPFGRADRTSAGRQQAYEIRLALTHACNRSAAGLRRKQCPAFAALHVRLHREVSRRSAQAFAALAGCVAQPRLRRGLDCSR